MKKTKLILMSSIAAVPALILLIVLTNPTSLKRFLELEMAFQVLAGAMWASSLAVAVLPVGILLFGPKTKKPEKDATSESEEKSGDEGKSEEEAAEEPEAAMDESDDAEVIPDDEFSEFDEFEDEDEVL